KAGWALDQNRFDAAFRLFEQARRLDPNCLEARNGMDLVQRFRDGKLDPKKFREELRRRFRLGAGDKGGRVDAGRHRPPDPAERRLRAEADRKVEDPLAPPEARDTPLADVKARRAVADQQATALVNDTIRQANRLVQTDPDAAGELLKRTRDGIQNNPDLSPQ